MSRGKLTNRFVSYKNIMKRLNESPYNIDLPEHVVLQNIFDFLNNSGLLAIDRHCIAKKVKDCKVDIPCNAFDVISVCAIADSYSNLIRHYDIGVTLENYNRILTEDDNITGYVNAFKRYYVDYTIEDDTITLKENVGRVIIEYDGIREDEEGYPLILEDAELAALTYVVMIDDMSRFRANPNNANSAIYQNSIRLHEEAKTKAQRPKFNRNQLNKALKVMYSYKGIL